MTACGRLKRLGQEETAQARLRLTAAWGGLIGVTLAAAALFFAGAGFGQLQRVEAAERVAALFGEKGIAKEPDAALAATSHP